MNAASFKFPYFLICEELDSAAIVRNAAGLVVVL